MRAPFFFSLGLFAVGLSVAASSALADCAPAPPSGPVCLGETCPVKKKGTATMDSDQANLIVCLPTSATDSTMRWKRMSIPGPESGTYSVPFSTLAGYHSGCKFNGGSWSANDEVNCTSGCNGWCKSDPSVADKHYTGGYITEWNSGTGEGGCHCS